MFAKAVPLCQDVGFANPLFLQKQKPTLRREASALPFRKAQTLVGKDVYQDFSICFPAPLMNSFKLVAQMLEQACKNIAKERQGLFESEVKINTILPCRVILLIREVLAFIKTARIVILCSFSPSMGSLSYLSFRSSRLRSPAEIDNPGRLVILPAPGLAYIEQEDQRPFMVLIMLLRMFSIGSSGAMPAKSRN